MASMDPLFRKYQNIRKFATEYRKYREPSKSAWLSEEEFTEKMQSLSYVKHTLQDPESDRDVVLVLFKDESKYLKSSQVFRTFMDNLIRPWQKTLKVEVILIIKSPLLPHIKNNLVGMYAAQFPLSVYFHRVFLIELNKGPFCSVHTRLTQEEVNYLCSRELFVLPTNLPVISAEDPQIIWIGAKVGEVVKIESYSDLTGKSIRYRFVSDNIPTVELEMDEVAEEAAVSTKANRADEDDTEPAEIDDLELESVDNDTSSSEQEDSSGSGSESDEEEEHKAEGGGAAKKKNGLAALIQSHFADDDDE